MLSQMTEFVRRPTSKDVIINTLGTYLNAFFSALFVLILVRIFTPAQYGVLGVLLGIAYVLANILDFGTTATIYSYFPLMYEKKTYQLYRFVKSTFFYQSIFSFVVLTILFIFFPYLDRIFFKTYAPWWELYLTAFSVLFLIWQNFAQNLLFAAKKFVKTNIYLNIANVLKTIGLFALIFTKTLTVGGVIFVFGILGPLIFFLLIFIEKKELVFILVKSEVKREEFRFGYTLTYFVASQFFNLGTRMDLFLLSYYLSKSDVGYYAIAQKIILTVIATVVSITQVLSPQFSKVKKKQEVQAHLKTGFLYLLIPCFLFIILFFAPQNLFNFVFTGKFSQTAPITKALSLPYILYTLGSLPTLFLLYTIKKPGYILYSNIIFFIVLTVGCYFLIPIMGVFGPPYAIGLAMILAIGMQVLISYKEYLKIPS